MVHLCFATAWRSKTLCKMVLVRCSIVFHKYLCQYSSATRSLQIVQDFAAISPLISHALADRLSCTPAEHPLLLTEPPWNTPANRERMAEIMFEEFQVPRFLRVQHRCSECVSNHSTPSFPLTPRTFCKVCRRDGDCSGCRYWSVSS